MTGLLIYEGKVAVALLVFYLFYRFLLKKETFHRFNRVVLVGTAVLSFLLPFCIITIHRPLEAASIATDAAGIVSVPSGFTVPDLPGGEHSPVVAPATTPWWPTAIAVLFWAGMAFVLIRILISIWSIMRIVRAGEPVLEEDGCKVIVTERDIDPFSWMKYIVLSRKDWEGDHTLILAHEKAHIALGHSREVLLVDILSSLQWFNPAIWMLRADLQELHEYEADDAVLRAGTNIKEYQYLLIRKAVSKSGYSVANSFNHSILKNRITMMSKSKSPLSKGLRVLWLLPLVCLGIGLQAQTVYAQSDNTSSIVGQAIQRFLFVNLDKSITATFEISVTDAETILVADGDTLRTQGGSGGIFTYSGISAGNVTLSVVIPNYPYSFSGSFELMPGENIVLVSVQTLPQPEGFLMQASEEPMFEMDGDTWTYYYPTAYDMSTYSSKRPDDNLLLVNRLKDLPGVEFNKRRNTLTISGPAVHKTFVNGDHLCAYVFGLNPEASE